jgi:hypothetical protein
VSAMSMSLSPFPDVPFLPPGESDSESAALPPLHQRLLVESAALPPLHERLLVEWTAAMLSALSVSPAIVIVDRAIVSNASGLQPLLPCVISGVKNLFTKPMHFLRQPSFLVIWGVCFCTYTVANSTEAICEYNERSSFYSKFFATSFANVSLSLLKDKAFARMFGVGAVNKLFPMRSYPLFATRDSMTIVAAFTLPGPISLALQDRLQWSPTLADNTAQLFTPVSMQVLSTPLHLHGMDLYNRNGRISLADRLSFIKQEYVKTTLARMARMFPAFGIGGVINKYIRTKGIGKLHEKYDEIMV